MLKRLAFPAFVVVCTSAFFSCERSSSQTWEDIQTAGRYMNRGIDSLFGKNYDMPLYSLDGKLISSSEEFIPLDDKDLQAKTMDVAYPQAKMDPGSGGVPLLEKFHAPATQLQTVFKTLYFDTDDHVVKNKEDLFAVQKIAAYMKKHPHVYLCAVGHADERASAAYNMALATRRANHVRVLLIKHGIDFNRIYTVSKGKEEPLALGHSPEDWQKNRRVQFKIFEKK